MSDRQVVVSSYVRNGKITSIPARNRIQQLIESFEGKEVEVIVRRKRKHRSNPQNRYYWAVVVPIIREGIMDSWGDNYSKEKTHDLLKAEFLYDEKPNEETGEFIRIIKSTKECSTTEMMEYIEECKKFATEWFGVSIPDAGEQLRIE